MPEDAASDSAPRLVRLASPLFSAKLRPPVVPEHHVRRPRLLRLLDEAVSAPLTLVIAPAGVGKTVLVVELGSRVDRAHGLVVLGRGRSGRAPALVRRDRRARDAATGMWRGGPHPAPSSRPPCRCRPSVVGRPRHGSRLAGPRRRRPAPRRRRRRGRFAGAVPAAPPDLAPRGRAVAPRTDPAGRPPAGPWSARRGPLRRAEVLALRSVRDVDPARPGAVGGPDRHRGDTCRGVGSGPATGRARGAFQPSSSVRRASGRRRGRSPHRRLRVARGARRGGRGTDRRAAGCLRG